MKKGIIMSLMLMLSLFGVSYIQNVSAVKVDIEIYVQNSQDLPPQDVVMNMYVQNFLHLPSEYNFIAPMGSTYYIKSARELNWVSCMVQQGHTFQGYNIEIVNDLDFCGIDFLPIGNHDRPFQGHLDGKGNKICGLELYYPNNIEIGLVGCLGANGLVENVNMASSCKFNGYGCVGGIVGYNFGLVRHCSSRAKLSARYGCVGGIVGYNYTTGIIKDCKVWSLSKIRSLYGKGGRRK